MTLKEPSHKPIPQKDFLPSGLDELFSKISSLNVSLPTHYKEGSLYQKYIKCVKNCSCNKLSHPGHGPYWYCKTSKKEIYIGKYLPENLTTARHHGKQLAPLIKDYAKIELLADELRHQIKEFVLKAEPIISFYQNDESNPLFKSSVVRTEHTTEEYSSVTPTVRGTVEHEAQGEAEPIAPDKQLHRILTADELLADSYRNLTTSQVKIYKEKNPVFKAELKRLKQEGLL